MNLYPYTVEPIGTLPWTAPTKFASVSPCVDAILESDGGFAHFRPHFVHHSPPTSEKWTEILLDEGYRHGGPHEAGYLLGRARLPLSAAQRYIPTELTPGGPLRTGYRAGNALPQVPKTRNLEWGFFGVWRANYLSTDDENRVAGKIPPPSIAWTFILSARLELRSPNAGALAIHPRTLADRITEHLDMPADRHLCEHALEQIATGINWKVAILRVLLLTPFP